MSDWMSERLCPDTLWERLLSWGHLRGATCACMLCPFHAIVRNFQSQWTPLAFDFAIS